MEWNLEYRRDVETALKLDFAASRDAKWYPQGEEGTLTFDEQKRVCSLKSSDNARL